MASINRRRFIAVSAGVLAPAAVGRAFQERRQADRVIVIGAGLAGLRAATALRRAGREVVVLEARTRPGGRVLTIRSFDDGLFAEAGPIRIAPAHRTVLAAVQEYGLTLVPFVSNVGAPIAVTPPSTDALRADEQRQAAADLLERYVGKVDEDLAQSSAESASYRRWQQYDRLSWPAWLASRGASPAAVRLMTLGGDSERLSALYLLRQFAMLRGSAQRYKIVGGMDLLPRAMAAALGNSIKYGAAVVRVDQTRGGAVVTYRLAGRDERIGARRVVVAVPLSTFRHITFDPALSLAKDRASKVLKYYPAARFLLQSRTRFWLQHGLSGSARTAKAEIWDCTYDLVGKTRGILGVSLGSGRGLGTAPGGEQDALAFGRDAAAEALPRILETLEKSVLVNWAEEPWSEGAFVTYAPGEMTAFSPVLWSEPEGALHFAGEHTSSWMTWMEGALESGDRVAREVLAA